MAHGQHPPAQAPSSPLAGEWVNVELALRQPDLWQGGSLNSGALARVMRVLERVLRMVGEGVRGPAGARYKLLADQSLRRSRGQRGVPLACCPPHRARERQGQQGEGRGVHGLGGGAEGLPPVRSRSHESCGGRSRALRLGRSRPLVSLAGAPRRATHGGGAGLGRHEVLHPLRGEGGLPKPDEYHASKVARSPCPDREHRTRCRQGAQPCTRTS